SGMWVARRQIYGEVKITFNIEMNLPFKFITICFSKSWVNANKICGSDMQSVDDAARMRLAIPLVMNNYSESKDSIIQAAKEFIKRT
ncbi:hypothetical protein PIB30_099019, partial [Stylosanthes scabra]|nr:hypothetical protein [Stylosanthes scabra]